MVSPNIYRRKQLSEAAGTGSDSAYVLLQGKVYDVRDFVPEHPGGDVILSYVNSGEDAIDAFLAFHPPSAFETLANFYIGDLDTQVFVPQSKVSFGQAIERLRLQLYQDGMFQSSKFYYVFKVLFNYSMFALSMYILVKYASQSTLSLLFSAALLGMFWQQCGWLAHDFLHHQVFADRKWNDVLGFLLGNVTQGFSVGWWKNKHNTHHAMPNVHGHDPDIDTMPILGWSEHALEALKEMAAKQNKSLDYYTTKFLVTYQAYTYFLVLTFARLSWCWQSIKWNFDNSTSSLTCYPVELATLAMHWIGYVGSMVYFLDTWSQVLLYFIASQASCGLFLALVFSLNHNGMPILSREEAGEMDFYSKQVLTGRDIQPNAMVTWFTGGLNYQIEHHLFPSLPRHNFSHIQKRIQALCREYNIPYHVTGFTDGTMEVLQRLSQVSESARTA